MAIVREKKVRPGLWKGLYIRYTRKPYKRNFRFTARQKGKKINKRQYRLTMWMRRK